MVVQLQRGCIVVLLSSPNHKICLVGKLWSNLVLVIIIYQCIERDTIYLCYHVYTRYRSMGHSASQQLSSTFFLLLDSMQFFDQYHAKRIDIAFEVFLCTIFQAANEI